MVKQTIAVGALALALALTGCTPSSGQAALAQGGTSTAEPTTAGTPTVAETGVASPTATTETPTPVLMTPTATPTVTLQLEQIEIDATGQLSPEVISATVGMTLELMLVNRSSNEAVLMLDVTPAGTLSVPLPAATITNTTPIALTPTGTAIVSGTPTLEPTGTAIVSGTPTLEPTGTAIVTGTLTPTPPAVIASVRTIWLRIDQPGSYMLRCIPAEPGLAPACTGAVTIIVAPLSSPTPTATPLATVTLEPTGTAEVTGTATLEPTGTAEPTATP